MQLHFVHTGYACYTAPNELNWAALPKQLHPDENPMPRPKICVVGASNIDLIAYAPRLPKLGETVPGSNFRTGFGGKGANQAVMAAKLGER